MSDRVRNAGRKAYLLVLAPGAERSRLAEYLDALPRLQAGAGGRMLALASAMSIEHFGHNGTAQSVMLSAWESLDALLGFWQSPAHRSPATRARGAEDLRVIAVEGEPQVDGIDTEAIAVFLGPGPSPALLEAEGAHALALVRERGVLRLRGDWEQGDVAIYAWGSAASARRPMLTFSSGQRGQGLLVPALGGARQAARATLQQAAA
jgi:uncharacterized protein (DUF1330 family)